MRGGRIADAVRRGTGRAAGVIGEWCEAYRAAGCDAPLAPANRFLRLPASFAPPGAGWRPPTQGGAYWWGTFDSAYTRVGDFIRRKGEGDEAIWFIASQEHLLPILCVRTNCLIDVMRPAAAEAPGLNGYGGVVRRASLPVARGWPASRLASGGQAVAGAALPGGVAAGGWQVLMPAVPGATLRNGDLVADGGGGTGVIGSAELTAMGWRLHVRAAAA